MPLRKISHQIVAALMRYLSQDRGPGKGIDYLGKAHSAARICVHDTERNITKAV